MSKELDDAVRRVFKDHYKASDPKSHSEVFKNRLAFFLIGSFVSVLPFLLFKDIPTANKEIIVYILGQLSGMAATVLAYYFINKVGADELDSKRADTTKAAFEAVTAASNSTPNNIIDSNTISDGDTVSIKKEIEP